jgi:transglutaminase-like putative cysteine protease/uncharacterized protein (DUF58 family)
MPRWSIAPSEAPGRWRLPRLTSAAFRLVLVTLGLLGAAVNTGNNLVYLMFSLLMAALPVSIALGVLNLRRVRCALKLPAAPRVGAPFAVDIEIATDRRWPAVRSAEVVVLTDQDPLGPVLVERVAAGETLRTTLIGRGARRGPIRIRGVLVRSIFPFGFLRCELRFERADELLILPSAGRAAARGDILSRATDGDALSARVVGTEYAGLRRGTEQDDARKVDWKVTARRGVTIVRETAGESGQEVRLDVATKWGGEPDAARRRFEEHVSAVAGRAQGALEAGSVVHLRVDSGAARTYAGRRAVLQLFRRLARLTPTTEDGTPLPQLPVEPAPRRPKQQTEDRASGPGRVHRASGALAVVIGSIALFVADGIGPLLFGLILASTIVTTFFGRLILRERSLGTRLWQAASIVALVAYIVDLLIARRDPLAASLMLTVFITLLAIFSTRTARDDRRLLLVSFLHIVLAAALTTEVAIALPLLAWLLATIQGLMAWTAMVGVESASLPRTVVDPGASRLRYAAPGFGACAAVLATGLVVFAVVPHFGTGAFRPNMFRPQALTGFSDTTRLGDIGRIKLDRSKVMEVDLSGPMPEEADLRWRGLALNEFDGRTWTRSYGPHYRHSADENGRFFPSGGSVDRAPGSLPASADMLTQSVRLEPGTASALFSTLRPRVIVSRDFRRLAEDDFGNLEFSAKPTRRLSYIVASEVPAHDAGVLRRSGSADPANVRSFNLPLPRLDRRVSVLAREITANAPTRYDAALAIESWLSSRLDYSLEVDDRGSEDPLARFLFDGMAGHCEYFASAMVVLAREVGIPSRFVAGYLPGERGGFGERYVVRQSDAHSWVEVYFPGAGWVPFDPTPPAGRSIAESRALWSLATYLHSSVTRLWDDYLVGIDLDDQARGLLALTGAVNDLSGRIRAAWHAFAAWHPLRLALLAIALIVLFFAGRRAPDLWRLVERRKATRRQAAAMPTFYAKVVELLSKRGLSRRPGETPAEFAERAKSVVPHRAADRLDDLTRLYYRVRFDGVTDERRVARIARALLTDVRTALPEKGTSRFGRK